MAVRLNEEAFKHAWRLIRAGKVVLDERDDWSEHKPTSQQQNEFIRQHGWAEFTKWYLGIQDAEAEASKGRYKFPYGDFTNVHHCGVLAVEVRAAQYYYEDIETAAARLNGLIHEMMGARGRSHR
jgi:hypothetical protein